MKSRAATSKEKGRRIPNRGFIFSIDAIIASAISLIAIISIIFYASDVSLPDYQREDLYILGKDMLLVIKDKGSLETMLIGDDGTQVQGSMDTLLPLQVCSRLKAYSQDMIMLETMTKSGCPQDPDQAVIVRMPAVIEGRAYIVEISMWYR